MNAKLTVTAKREGSRDARVAQRENQNENQLAVRRVGEECVA